MTILRNLFFLFAITIFTITSTILAVYNYNPFSSNISVFMDFYISFFFALAGIIAIAIYYIKSRKTKSEDAAKHFWSTVRESCFISLAVTVILALQGLKMLDLLVGSSVIIVTVLLELFFRTKKVQTS